MMKRATTEALMKPDGRFVAILVSDAKEAKIDYGFNIGAHVRINIPDHPKPNSGVIYSRRTDDGESMYVVIKESEYEGDKVLSFGIYREEELTLNADH